MTAIGAHNCRNRCREPLDRWRLQRTSALLLAAVLLGGCATAFR
jgi:hypothetical protein